MADAESLVDGIAPPASMAAPVPDAAAVRRWKTLFTGIIGISFVSFILWCGILLLLLPSTSPGAPTLVRIGLLTLLIGAGVIILVSLLSLLHIARAPATGRGRTVALVKLGALAVPALLLSGATAFFIVQEPPLPVDIVTPSSTADLVAPVTMTFSLQTARQALSSRGFTAVRYRWDIDGDGKIDSETFEPTLTASYDRAGIFTVAATLVSASNETRIARRRIYIQQAVFSVTPATPLVDRPVVFDLSNLLTQGLTIVSAEWDFDGDGTVDETAAGPQISTTYYRTGGTTVSVRVRFSNNTQVSYRRTIDVQEPPPLPFPVRIVSNPEHLVSTAPFTALFSIETEERVANVQWQFGDGGRGEGREVAHTFARNGTYPVLARVRSLSGAIAEVSTSVSIVQRLELSDLTFEGSPAVSGNRIEGEVPLTVNLTPVTAQPFITFVWEAPNATNIGSTEGSLQAIYRREGTYTVTLVGTSADGKVLRRPISIVVRPPSSVISFRMEPESGVAPLTVRFDASETSIPGDDITGFIWGYGDATPKEIGGAYTEHTYRSPGTYVIDLTVRTAGGRQQSVTRSLTVRAPVLQACILPSRLRGAAPFGVEFSSDCSTGDLRSVLWDFGDGSQSDERNPVHVFMTPGTYPIRLTVTDTLGATHATTLSLTAE